MLRKMIRLGSVRYGTRIRVSDPCYNMDTWCAGTLDNVLPGEYLCTAEVAYTGKKNGGCVSALQVRHADYPEAVPDELVTSFEAGVDSAQLGFFDEKYFAENVSRKDWKNWYGEVREATSHMAGTLAGCSCVSVTGYGDGCYPVYIARNSSGKIIAVKAVFLTTLA